MIPALLLEVKVSRPTISAASASLGGQLVIVSMDTGILAGFGLTPENVAECLRFRIYSVGTGVPAVLATTLATTAEAVISLPSSNGRQHGTNMSLGTLGLVAGAYQCVALVDVWKDIKNDLGVKVLDSDSVGSVSVPFYVVAS